MTEKTGRLLEEGSEKHPIVKDAPVRHISAPLPTGKMGRWIAILFLTGLFTLLANARGSGVSLSIEQRVDKILSETPLIGMHKNCHAHLQLLTECLHRWPR